MMVRYPISAFSSNNYMMHDMIGKQWELTSSEYNENPHILLANGITPKSQDTSNIMYVLKGGGFLHIEGSLYNNDGTDASVASVTNSNPVPEDEYKIHVGERQRGLFGTFRLVRK